MCREHVGVTSVFFLKMCVFYCLDVYILFKYNLINIRMAQEPPISFSLNTIFL